MRYVCTNRRECVLQDRDSTRYCGQPKRECGFKEPAMGKIKCEYEHLGVKCKERRKVMKDLLEAAEEMYEYCGPNWANAEQWEAAIKAARKEIE